MCLIALQRREINGFPPSLTLRRASPILSHVVIVPTGLGCRTEVNSRSAGVGVFWLGSPCTPGMLPETGEQAMRTFYNVFTSLWASLG